MKLFKPTCNWKKAKNQCQYTTSCVILWDVSNQMIEAYKYCPNCGKMIVIKKE